MRDLLDEAERFPRLRPLPRPRSSSWSAATFLVALGCALGSACGGTDSAPTGEGGSASDEGPLYVLSARVSAGSELASSAVIVDSLDAGTEADFQTSIEISNGGIAV